MTVSPAAVGAKVVVGTVPVDLHLDGAQCSLVAFEPSRVVALVALHQASVADLPAGSDLMHRHRLRGSWAAALKPVALDAPHDDFALAYLPGVGFGDSMCWAVHLPTGTVFDDASGRDGVGRKIPTAAWIAALRVRLDA